MIFPISAVRGLLAFPEAKLDRELLALYGLDDAVDFFPRLVESADIVGHVTAELRV
jgi:L-xylulokinase